MRRNVYGLGSSHFDRHYFGNRYFFLFLQVLRCFSSLRVPDLTSYIVFNYVGSPIRISPDQFLFANPRSFSQLTTSFFTSGSLGIPRSLFFSFSYLWILSDYLQSHITRFAYEIAVPILATRKNSNFLNIRLNLFFTSLPRYLSQYCQWSFNCVPLVRGVQR